MSNKRPFRFGFFTSGASTRSTWIETVKSVEDAGFSTLMFGDHVGFPLAPLTALMAAAEATTVLRLGGFLFGNDFRHPVLLAKEAATIDLLSGGRFEFGLGTGYMAADYERMGIPLDPPGVRVSRFTEAIQVVKGFFGEEPFSFDGRFYQVKELNGLPKPAQRPRPPLILGGGGKRMLTLAAQEADIVSVNIKTTPAGGFDFDSITPEALRKKVNWVRQAADDRFDELELNMMVPVVAVTDDRQRAAEEMMERWGMEEAGYTVDWLLASPSVLIGPVDQIVDTLRERRELYGFSYIVPLASLEDFRPVVARLAGK